MHRVFSIFVMLIVILTRVSSGMAQSPAQSEAVPSISVYETAVQLGEAAVIGSDWIGCVKYFTQAHKLKPSEITFLAIGRCSLESGDYLQALRHLQEGMRYALTERQRVSVENLKTRALQHLGHYRVRLEPANATLLISGEQPQLDSEGAVWLKVGRYPVTVSAVGYEQMQGELVVQAGDDGTISYSLPALAPESPIAAASSGSPGSSGSGAENEPFPVVPVVVVAAGGVLLIASIVTGVLALGKKGDLDSQCTLGPNGNSCSPTLADTRDAARTLGIVTDVLWITGTLTVGTGVLLYLLRPHEEREPSVRVDAALGRSGGALALSGRF